MKLSLKHSICLSTVGLILVPDAIESFNAPSSSGARGIFKHKRNLNSFLFLASTAPNSREDDNEEENFASSYDIGSRYLDQKTLLDAIGLTAYGSSMIYEVAALRKIVDTHSYCVRKKRYGGQPAQKKRFGSFKKDEPVIKFKGPEESFRQFGEKKGGLLEYDITAEAVTEFIKENSDHIGVNRKGELRLKETNEPAATEPENNGEESVLYKNLSKLKYTNVRIVAFDDKFQNSELIYAIAINDSEKRISLVFRGSVLGNKDWPTNLNFGQISVKDLESEIMSEYITKDDASKVSDAKLHRGFTNYLFADLATEKKGPTLYREYYSKFDKIVSALETIYEETDEDGNLKHDDYQLIISGHSLGGALAQLITFIIGSCKKCCSMFPTPILAVTYASPPVGNEAFSAEMYNLEKKNIARHVRITNEGDLVPVLFFFDGYTQSGCNFYVRDNQEMKLGGFGNTQTIFSEFRFNLSESGRRHGVGSHQQHLFYKVGGKNVNFKIWKRYLTDCFTAVEEGKDLSSVPDERPYEVRFVVELKEELRARGFRVPRRKGRKDDLIQRLREDDESKRNATT